MMKLQLEVLKNNFYHIENPISGSEVRIIYNMESGFLLEMYEKINRVPYHILYGIKTKTKMVD